MGAATGAVMTKRQVNDAVAAQLDTEYTTFKTHHRELSENILPRRSRFLNNDVNKGDKRNGKILDNTATQAVVILRSGMMSGITSPARPWFRLTTPDPATAEAGSVKEWLHLVSKRMATVFLRSNLYQCLPILYGDIGVFGTSALYIEEDFNDIIRCYPFPIGSYRISNNEKLKVDVFSRDFQMTVRQLVAKFGNRKNGEIDWSNFSTEVKAAWDNAQFETWIQVRHIIQPNPEHREDSPLSVHKKYSSCYYEIGRQNDIYLSEKGYDYFPVLCPRWEITGEDAYATSCPGMTALGDIKQLQSMEKKGNHLLDLQTSPPMKGPSSLRTSRNSILPGDMNFDDSRDGRGFQPVFQVNPSMQDLEFKEDQIRKRIKRALFEDLFLMMPSITGRDVTATEVEERREEKLLVLGPVLEQLNQDLLDPLIDITFDIMLARSKDADGNFLPNGFIPEPPAELQGVGLKVEYTSIMAQAQKAISLGTLDRLGGLIAQLATVDPGILHKIDLDEYVDDYADALGTNPSIVRSDEEAQASREAAAAPARAQMQADMINQGSAAVRNLSQADMSGKNALTQLISQANAGQVAPAS